MSPRLVFPVEAARILTQQLLSRLPAFICDELHDEVGQEISIGLRPGVSHERAIRAVGWDQLQGWRDAWDDIWSAPDPHVRWERRALKNDMLPSKIRVTKVDSVLRLISRCGIEPPDSAVELARERGRELLACGGILTSRNLRTICRLRIDDWAAAMAAIDWFTTESDVSRWSARQVPAPGIHSKWIETHRGLIRDLLGRDPVTGLRARPAVVHLTYVDPQYRQGASRIHDAWTSGDRHEPAYQPRVVIVVENRECRLWFPPMQQTVVVEGAGDAAATLLPTIPWIRAADTIAYWGDLDSDGFGILDRFRRAMRIPSRDGGPAHEVLSMLMDLVTLERYADLGTRVDRKGRPLVRDTSSLNALSADEDAAYRLLTTAGASDVRRVEQERLPAEAVVEACTAVLRRTTR